MTTRKPPGVSFPDWVERQIRSAEAEGSFAKVSGAGKPIPDIDRPRGELDWLANYLRREEVEVAGLLPPALALAKEVEQLPERLARERSEHRARAVVEELNERIRRAQLAPQDGPAFRVRTVQVDAALERWRVAEAARVVAARVVAARVAAARVAAARVAAAAPRRDARRRRWWRRRPPNWHGQP